MSFVKFHKNTGRIDFAIATKINKKFTEIGIKLTGISKRGKINILNFEGGKEKYEETAIGVFDGSGNDIYQCGFISITCQRCRCVGSGGNLRGKRRGGSSRGSRAAGGSGA